MSVLRGQCKTNNMDTNGGKYLVHYVRRSFNTYNKAEAIAAWNQRHVETCENMREKFGYKRLFVCSECGVTFDPDCEINYCPWCGREVVDNAD